MKDFKLYLDHGTEGPNEDPYSYTEMTVINGDGTKIILHLGLMIWISIDGKQIHCIDEETAEKNFFYFTGMTPDEFEEEYYMREYTCSDCGTYNDIEWICGFPGEQLGRCAQCGNIVTSIFNESAIM